MAAKSSDGDGAPKLLDADELIDEIIAKKGPVKYEQGLSEENWEEVRACPCSVQIACLHVVYWVYIAMTVCM